MTWACTHAGTSALKALKTGTLASVSPHTALTRHSTALLQHAIFTVGFCSASISASSSSGSGEGSSSRSTSRGARNANFSSSSSAATLAGAQFLPPLARSLSNTASRSHEGIHRPEPGEGIKVTFRDSKGNDIKTVEANEGDDLLSIAHEYDVDLEGACEGSIACSTCHVILEPNVYDSLEEPGDDENDMLDLAFGLTDTSRLGCQIKLTKDMDGMVAQLPSATRNMSFKKD